MIREESGRAYHRVVAKVRLAAAAVLLRRFPMLRTTPTLCAITFAIASFNAFSATPFLVAQPPPGPPTLESAHLTCGEFKLNQDGSWSPVHPMQIGAAAIGPSTSLREGTYVADYDLAAMLDKVCR
jgi:hypothetical protein